MQLLGHIEQEPRAAVGADDRSHGRPHLSTTVGPDDDVLRQHGEKTRKIAGGAGHQETVGQGAALAQIGIEALAPLLNVGPRGDPSCRQAAGDRPRDCPTSSNE